MLLPSAPAQYSQADEQQARGIMQREDKQNVKRGNVFDAILMRDTVTGGVVTVTVASGALVVT